MFDPFSLLPRKKRTYKAFVARKGEAPFSRSNDDPDEVEWIRTAPTNSFEIRETGKVQIAPKFCCLYFPVYNALGKNLALVFNNLVVKIEGEHLQELLLSIRRETCVYIKVFNEKEFIRPKKGEAIITRVEIVKGEMLEAYCLEMEDVMKGYSAEMDEWMQPDTLPEPAS